VTGGWVRWGWGSALTQIHQITLVFYFSCGCVCTWEVGFSIYPRPAVEIQEITSQSVDFWALKVNQ
jgi:hypothetical protein